MSKSPSEPAIPFLSPRISRLAGRRAGLLLVAGAAAVAALMPLSASAQFSESYKFLEAVRKKEGEKVEQALMDTNNRIVLTKDATSGETALHIVTARRDITWLGYLMAKGADVNARDDRGRTPLQVAVNLGWRDGVEALIDRKASVNETDDAGETPLITAVHNHDLALARILLNAGADPDRADNSGRSARDYATIDGKDSSALALIQQFGAAKAKTVSKPVYGPTF